MTATAPEAERRRDARPAVRTYERLLLLYPRAFRDEYGPDMVQVFGDLVDRMGRGSPVRLWSRVVRDLVTSAVRQHVEAMVAPGGRRPRAGVVLAVVLAVGLSVVVGNPLFLPLALIVMSPAVGSALFVLPVVGGLLLRRSWVAWRTVGARPWIRAPLGVACFGPGTWWVIAHDGGGWWTFILIVISLISGLGLGAIWAIITLVRARRTATSRRRRTTAIGLVVVAVAVLGGMAAAGFHSYLESRPPPGDHSPAHASPESRALWDAADAGDVDTVIAMIDACADPFVHFDDGGRARSNAEWWAGINHSGRDPVGEPMLSAYLDIVDRLRTAEDTWSERCNP